MRACKRPSRSPTFPTKMKKSEFILKAGECHVSEPRYRSQRRENRDGNFRRLRRKSHLRSRDRCARRLGAGQPPLCRRAWCAEPAHSRGHAAAASGRKSEVDPRGECGCDCAERIRQSGPNGLWFGDFSLRSAGATPGQAGVVHLAAREQPLGGFRRSGLERSGLRLARTACV